MENKETIRVSVIVPVYNAERYLRRCLDSILQQSLEKIEILAVDDGSKDHSADILKEYEKNYPDKIHAIYQENQGQSAARNHALAMASGEFVAFVSILGDRRTSLTSIVRCFFFASFSFLAISYRYFP